MSHSQASYRIYGGPAEAAPFADRPPVYEGHVYDAQKAAYPALQPPPVAVPVAMPVPLAPMPPPAGTPVALYTPPRSSLAQLRTALQSRVVDFNGGRYFEQAWQFYKKNACVLISVVLFWGVVGLLFAAGSMFALTGGNLDGLDDLQPHHHDGYDGYGHEGDDGEEGYGGEDGYGSSDTDDRWNRVHNRLGRLLLVQAVFGLFSLLVLVPAIASAYAAIFKAIQTSTRLRFSQMFACFNCSYFCPLLGLSLVLVLGQALGFICFLLPGLWWSVATVFAMPLHHQHKPLGCTDAIRFSILVAHRHFCPLLGFLLLVLLLQAVGAMFFGFGLLLTVPVGFTALCFCYHHLIGVNETSVPHHDQYYD